MRYRYDILQQTQEVIDHIISDIHCLPNGYLWWHNLPPKGKKSPKAIKNRWGRLIRQNLFTTKFMHAMLLACFTPEGIVIETSRPLYSLLLKVFYNNKEVILYQNWLTASRIYHANNSQFNKVS